MSICVRRTCLWLAGAALIGLVACESNTKPTAAPGALPQSHGGLTPRLTASTFVAHGELLERRGDYEGAAQQYRRALEVAPDLVTARNRLGVTLNKLGHNTEASAEFRWALSRQPNQAYLYNNLGFSLCLEKKYEEAEPVLARALELQPDFRRARMNHGLVLARLGRYDEALIEFTCAGSEADAHYNLAIVQADDGDYAAAARSLDQALRSDPEFAAARDQLRQISRLAAAQEAAQEAAHEAAELASKPAEPTETMPEPPSSTAIAAEPEPLQSGTAVVELAPGLAAVPAADLRIETPSPVVLDAPPAPIEVAETASWEMIAAVVDCRLGALYDRTQFLMRSLEHLKASAGGAAVLRAFEARLAEIFAQVTEAMATNSPWYEGCLQELELIAGEAE